MKKNNCKIKTPWAMNHHFTGPITSPTPTMMGEKSIFSGMCFDPYPLLPPPNGSRVRVGSIWKNKKTGELWQVSSDNGKKVLMHKFPQIIIGQWMSTQTELNEDEWEDMNKGG